MWPQCLAAHRRVGLTRWHHIDTREPTSSPPEKSPSLSSLVGSMTALLLEEEEELSAATGDLVRSWSSWRSRLEQEEEQHVQNDENSAVIMIVKNFLPLLQEGNQKLRIHAVKIIEVLLKQNFFNASYSWRTPCSRY